MANLEYSCSFREKVQRTSTVTSGFNIKINWVYSGYKAINHNLLYFTIRVIEMLIIISKVHIKNETDSTYEI